MRKLMILGASGHGKVVADIAKQNGYEDIGFLDDDPQIKSCGSYPVLGTIDDADIWKDADFFVAVGNCATRERLTTFCEDQDLRVISLIHPCAVIAEDAKIGNGIVIMAGRYSIPERQLGRGASSIPEPQ